MADNVEITAGTGTTIAADEVTRNAVLEKQQIVKVALGAEGVHDTLVDSGQQTMANSVPVVVASDQTAIPVSMSSAPLPTGGATAANQATQITAEQAIQAAVQIMDDWDDGADSAKVVGNIASGSSDSGNPVKVGGIYNSTLPTFTNGQRGDLQIGTRGSTHVTLFADNSIQPIFALNDTGDAVSADGTLNKLMVISRGTMFNGTTWDRVRGDATDGMLVNLGSNNDVTVTSGSITIQSNATVDITRISGNSAGVGADNADDVAVSATNNKLIVMSRGTVFDGTTWDRMRGDATDGVLVNLGTNNDVTVTGSVTANAGTNLNTSALLTTAAHDAAFGTAGSADTQVRTIQGIASMTPVQVGDNSSSLTVDNAGTFAVQDATAQASLSVMDDWDNAASTGAKVSGDVAHDGVDAGEPVKIGGKSTDVGSALTVANNDRANAAFLRNGVQLTLGGAHDIISKNLNVTDADGAQTDTALVTVSAGTAIVVTKASVMVDSATTATGGVAVRIGFGTANVPAADSAGIILAHPGISAGSGVIEGNGSGIIGIGASNEDLRVTCEDPTGGNIDIIITYFTIAIG